MANTMRWRYGETNPVVLPVDSATVIEIGDLLYLDTTAKPAGVLTPGHSPAPTQHTGHDPFARAWLPRPRAGPGSKLLSSGLRQTPCSGAVTLVAKAPWRSEASTLSPSATRVTPAPTALTTPAASKPGMKGRTGWC